jgi:hypothetical protein
VAEPFLGPPWRFSAQGQEWAAFRPTLASFVALCVRTRGGEPVRWLWSDQPLV